MRSIFVPPRALLGIVTAFGIGAYGAAHITAETCGRMMSARSGDTCASLASAAGITVAQFLRGNPGVISCSALTTGTSYCVDPEYNGTPSTTTSGPGRPTDSGSPLEVTQDGKCGDGLTCLGSSFGQCCSEHGWCGRTSDHCGATCQVEFGLCGSAGIAPSSTAATTPPVPTSLTISVTRGGGSTITEAITETTTIIQTETLQQPITSTRTIVATVPGPGITATTTATATQTIRLTQTLISISLSLSTTTSILPVTYPIPTTITASNPNPSSETTTRTILATIIAGTTTIVQLRTSTTLIPTTSTAYITERSFVFTTSTITTIKTITITNAAMCSSRTLSSIPRQITNSAAAGVAIPSASGVIKREDDNLKDVINGRMEVLSIRPGVVPQCQTFHRVREGDTCEVIVHKYKGRLDIKQFYALNTHLTGDCQGLWLGYWVCVGI